MECQKLIELLLLDKLNKKIAGCKLCPRLTKYIGKAGERQTKMFMNQRISTGKNVK